MAVTFGKAPVRLLAQRTLGLQDPMWWVSIPRMHQGRTIAPFVLCLLCKFLAKLGEHVTLWLPAFVVFHRLWVTPWQCETYGNGLIPYVTYNKSSTGRLALNALVPTCVHQPNTYFLLITFLTCANPPDWLRHHHAECCICTLFLPTHSDSFLGANFYRASLSRISSATQSVLIVMNE